MSTLSTHVLDTSLGRPAAGLRVTLEPRSDAGAVIGTGTTDANGRVSDVLGGGKSLSPGEYSIRFHVADYFVRTGREVFFPEVAVQFVVKAGDEHYHIPLLLSPFGYSTYRGS
jgi:5-hydroxyisourate hydrolase